MSLQLFAHPFSSYCQKALIALYWFGAWMPQLRERGGSDRKAGHSRPL